MSFESDINQLILYDNIKEKYLEHIIEKYKNRTFTVLKSPYRNSNFRVGESYSIDGFSIYHGEGYVINSENGINRTIDLNLIELNPLPSRTNDVI